MLLIIDEEKTMAKKIDYIDRDTVLVLRERLATNLSQFEEETGLNVKVGNASYTGGNVTFKVALSVVMANGIIMTKEAEAFQVSAGRLGLAPDDLFKTYGPYKIMGVNARATKYPILVEKDGQPYKISVSSIKYHKSLTNTK